MFNTHDPQDNNLNATKKAVDLPGMAAAGLQIPKTINPEEIKNAILYLGAENTPEDKKSKSLLVLKSASEYGQYDNLKDIPKSPLAFNYIHEKLKSSDQEQIIAALEVLGSIGEKESLDKIFPLFSTEIRKTETYAARAMAVRAACRIGQLENGMIEVLYERLNDASIQVTKETISGLPQIQGREKQGVQDIAKLLTSSIRPTVRTHVLKVLQNILKSNDPILALEAKEEIALLLTQPTQQDNITMREDQEEVIKLAKEVSNLLEEISK